MNKKINAIVIGAGNRGSGAYAPYALEHQDLFEIVGVAEPKDALRNYMKEKYNIPEVYCFKTWEDILSLPKFADAALICTQDSMHYGPSMKAISMGYHLLLEKPVSPFPEECMEIAKAAGEKGVHVLVCHVLRYTRFFRKIKEIIDSGRIGDIVSIVHNENVGDYHQAHSFVRGNWSNSETSAPMILAKSCHDVDILQWLIGKKCLKVSSFGSLKYFNSKNKPEGAPFRCIDGCPHAKECPYDAVKVYLEDKDNLWFRSVAASDNNPTDEMIENALRRGPYGRCVFQCDNNVVDHQVVNMEFEDGVTVSFTMCAFTAENNRAIKIMGTKGSICNDGENIIVTDFLTQNTETISTKNELRSQEGHGGGDVGIMNEFIHIICGGKPLYSLSEIDVSVASHMIAFAAEESRLAGKTVDIEEYTIRFAGGN